MVHADAVARVGRVEQARTLVAETLSELTVTPATPAGLGEERFFAHRVEKSIAPMPAATVAAEASISDLLRRHRRKLDLLSSPEKTKRWSDTRGRIEMAEMNVSADDRQGPRRFLEKIAPHDRLIVWRREPKRHGSGRPGVVGFRVQPRALRAFVTTLLSQRKDPLSDRTFDGRFKFQLDDSENAEGRLSVAVPGAFSFLRIRLDDEAWRLQLRESRRPYRIAIILLPALGAGMVLALVSFYLMFRKERFLSNMKTDFVANVSHELKTPLALIRLFGETLSLDRVREPEKRQNYYEIITRESERLTHLIDNVLDFASIEADKKTYDLIPTDLGQVATDTLRTYQFHLDDKGFRLTSEIAPKLPICLADGNAVSQALINLLHNAVKYSNEHKDVRVTVKAVDRTVKIQVADRGVGIPSEDRRRIFESFYRSKATSVLGRRGSGLGLTLVQHIAESHGGRVDVESEVGAGSTFTQSFPVADPPSPKKDLNYGQENEKTVGEDSRR